ncbi:MAG: hypothetical protein MJK13_10570, partial [Pseudomonadales bacterium]|nr:hypothetical protein [Pseudomonadales bacterium]
FIQPIKTGKGRNGKWVFHRLIYKSGRMNFDTLTEDYVENIRDCLDPEHDKYIVGNASGYGERPPFLFWPESEDYMFFVETKTVALPEFEEMKKILIEIRSARDQLIRREVLGQYCDDKPDSLIADICSRLLASSPDMDDFDYSQISSAIKKEKIKGRNKDKEEFYQWVESELGLLWKRSLKLKQDGYMNANLGFFFNRKEGAYYVGAKGSAQQTIANFSKIYRLASSLPVIPDTVLNLFKAIHIRHKQMTVYPYLFKHLREYSKSIVESEVTD